MQVNFVNDISFRYKEPRVSEENYIIDTIENILSNKITAIISRDNPKDIFDIYLIWKYYDFEWGEILDAAHKKAKFSNDELIIRLKSFPREFLKKIKVTDDTFLNNFDPDFLKIIDEIMSII